MIRRTLFWLHLSAGVAAGVFIFVMAATGVILSFERQIVELLDQEVRSVSVPSYLQPRGLNDLLDSVRRAGMGDPAAIVLRNDPKAASQFSVGRSKTLYVDPFTGAVLGESSPGAHAFFSAVERMHRSLGAPPGSKNAGHWLAAISNLVFGGLILAGLVLWIPRRWNWNAVRASLAFRTGLRGRAREWNWHNVVGIWCALPLLVIVLTGAVMSLDWANALLFRLTGSTPSARARGGESHPQNRETRAGIEPNYEYLFTISKSLNPDWHTITLSLMRDANAPLTAVIETGSGGQPQYRIQYLLNPDTGAVLKRSRFGDGNLGQRLRAFVRFGHTGEYAGWAGQALAALASFGACVLVYSGLSLSIRRLAGKFKSKRNTIVSTHSDLYAFTGSTATAAQSGKQHASQSQNN